MLAGWSSVDLVNLSGKVNKYVKGNQILTADWQVQERFKLLEILTV